MPFMVIDHTTQPCFPYPVPSPLFCPGTLLSHSLRSMRISSDIRLSQNIQFQSNKGREEDREEGQKGRELEENVRRKEEPKENNVVHTNAGEPSED